MSLFLTVVRPGEREAFEIPTNFESSVAFKAMNANFGSSCPDSEFLCGIVSYFSRNVNRLLLEKETLATIFHVKAILTNYQTRMQSKQNINRYPFFLPLLI